MATPEEQFDNYKKRVSLTKKALKKFLKDAAKSKNQQAKSREK